MLPQDWPTNSKIVEEASCRPDRAAGARVCPLPFKRDDSPWRFQRDQTASCRPPCEPISSDSFHPCHLFVLRAACAPLESVSTKPGSIAFRNDLRNDAGGLRGGISPWGRP